MRTTDFMRMSHAQAAMKASDIAYENEQLRQQLAEKDAEIERLKEDGNMPVKYYQPNSKGPVCAVYGASSINFADSLLEQRAALRKLAEEATPGPWLYDETELPAQRIHHPEGFLVARVAQMRTDGRYIAAANPSTILQLLDYIETMGKDAARYRWLRDACMDDPKTRLAVMNGFIDYETVDYIYGEGMDVAIDAAMQGETE